MINRSNYREFGLKEFTSTLQLYSTFNDYLDRVRIKYKCNLVVTSYDINVDKGYKSGFKEVQFKDLDSVSFLRGAYLKRFDYILFRGIEFKFWDFSHEQWIEG
ncbi:uncharacterized protein CANTADRAFT_7957 [Suhomyces tanzawaensis NRRL Y-17324]|uniref:Uncharacterized protein n=1 Tax=Suhomyces tanzawaensis NRRL Y-17324 TaxID=984487 RepID=A0A1E4SDF5_9ASCO|nr:uncharacterized protein CANTADRAFT_7957 [Suhomyces tanzawaensis NRRL Y-17324]ODV77496.1 hypothetical protein CANTADRAFT_7957 [Suhomyces tanzawaensis NRRL Y-17324]